MRNKIHSNYWYSFYFKLYSIIIFLKKVGRTLSFGATPMGEMKHDVIDSTLS